MLYQFQSQAYHLRFLTTHYFASLCVSFFRGRRRNPYRRPLHLTVAEPQNGVFKAQ